MAITTAMCTSFKKELLEGVHNFKNSGGDTFKMALIKDGMSGTYGAATTDYSDITGNSDEVSGTGYTAEGNTLTRVDPSTSGTTALTDFADTSWEDATFTARGAAIHNDTDSGAMAGVWDFGSAKAVSAGTFTVIFPTADASNAIIRL